MVGDILAYEESTFEDDDLFDDEDPFQELEDD